MYLAGCVLTGWSNRRGSTAQHWQDVIRDLMGREALSKTPWGYCVYKGVCALWAALERTGGFFQFTVLHLL